ncbi:MAG: PTS sugar transporter subunit IIA [Spiroplasma sp.]|nr:PTS sugar transporter subunit IIA [Spiroplasma sp.]
METTNILVSEQVVLDSDASDQKEVFAKIAELAKQHGFIKKEKKLIKAFKKREKESTTGFGDGFAIPHARTKDITKAGVFFVRLNNGVEWKALDGNPVNIIIALVVPMDKAADVHLDLLSKIAQKIIKPEVQKTLSTSKDTKQIIKVLVG